MGRRRKNPLLGRILIVSAIAHAIALPIMAKLGTFEKIQRQFTTQAITVVPPPKEEPAAVPKDEVKKAAEPEKKAPGPLKSAAPALNQPKVAASSAPGDAGGSGPVVNPEGTGKAGEIPKTSGTGGTGTQPVATTPKETPKVVEPKVTPKPDTEPATKPKVEATPKVDPPVPHVPILVAAESEQQPTIDIPESLRTDALDKTTVLVVTVSATGRPDEVVVSTSSGVTELDDLASRAAKQWKFRPATKDGEPVQGKVRLHIRFTVD